MVIAVLAVVVAFLMPPGHDPRYAPRIRCANNLKQIGIVFRAWALEHNDQFPMQVSVTNGGGREFVLTNNAFLYFQALSNELVTPKVLWCPTDKTRKPAVSFKDGFSTSNISYFVSLDAVVAYPGMFLTGDRNLTNGALLPNRNLELKSNSVVGWTRELHDGIGNVGLADGSVQSFTTPRIREALIGGGDVTNRLAMP